MKNLLEWVKDIAIAAALALILMIFFRPIIVRQQSMLNTFNPGDYVIASRQSYKLFGEPQRGDVIVFYSELTDENGKDKKLIKRIIGLPGETVEIKDGYVYVNGEKLEEDYIAEQGASGEMEAVTVPEGELFAMGDNRAVSLDSRSPSVGTVPVDSVFGKVVLRLYPFSDISTF